MLQLLIRLIIDTGGLFSLLTEDFRKIGIFGLLSNEFYLLLSNDWIFFLKLCLLFHFSKDTRSQHLSFSCRRIPLHSLGCHLKLILQALLKVSPFFVFRQHTKDVRLTIQLFSLSCIELLALRLIKNGFLLKLYTVQVFVTFLM